MASTSVRMVGGGLAAGLGEGLMLRAKRENEDLMLMKKEAMEDARQLRQQEFLGQEHQAELSERLQERQGEFTDRAAERQANQQERTGERADRIADSTADRVSREQQGELDRKSREKIASERGDGTLGSDEQRSLAKDRAWKRAVERFSKLPDNALPGDKPVTDWNAVGKAMDDQSYPDLGRQARGYTDEGDGGSDAAPPPTAAPPQASAPAKQGGGFDASWDPTAGRFVRSAAPAGGSRFTGKSIQGGGTKENPYQATDQSSIDWFKANAKPGDVLSYNGKLYTK